MAECPIRVQRRRAKGWRMPPNTVYVGRPSWWGNPFLVSIHGDHGECARLYRKVIMGKENPGDLTRSQLRAANTAWPDCFSMPCQDSAKIFLRGKNLACWCPLDQPCHADVLLELANH